MKKVNANIDELRDQLMSYFLQLAPDTDLNELKKLTEQFTLDKFPKKKMIIKPGDYSDCVFFIYEGLVRIYYIKEGKEITNWFIKENMIFAATYSILSGKKNYNYYEAIEDTYVLKIKYSILESYYSKCHSLEHLGRRIIETYYATFMKKTNDVLFLSAEERYHLFIRDHSDLINRVSLRYVASYLGITQETLSRLRAKH